MLEGFLNSVKSLTEVQLDSPAGKEPTVPDELRYHAELNVSGNDRSVGESYPVINSGSDHKEVTDTDITGEGKVISTEKGSIVNLSHEPEHEYAKENRKSIFKKVKKNIKRFFGKIFGIQGMK